MMSQSPSKKALWDFIQFSQLPLATLSYFPESHWWSEIASLSKVIFLLGKATSHKAPNLGCKGAESPWWLDVLQKKKTWCMRHDAWVGVLSWWSSNHRLSTAVALWIIQIVSMEECLSLTQIRMQIFCSVILNVTATQYTCSLNGVCHPTD